MVSDLYVHKLCTQTQLSEYFAQLHMALLDTTNDIIPKHKVKLRSTQPILNKLQEIKAKFFPAYRQVFQLIGEVKTK